MAETPLEELVADRIQDRMGPLVGSPEYLADPVKRARSEKRQRDAAEAYAAMAVAEVKKAMADPATLERGAETFVNSLSGLLEDASPNPWAVGTPEQQQLVRVALNAALNAMVGKP